ncbi:Abortive infection bacteriophage resistance protein [Ruminococcaceae bacterium KH2T8]|nr:Abortive infection bacteriophage resistance protein [Ruminococcaceae bacterium KH2T8]
MELKIPTTYAQQIEILKEKGVTIKNDGECLLFLSRVNYYYFTGYLLPYLDRVTDKCREEITFEKLISLYEFDAELRNLIISVVERIEIFIRNKISYFHGHKYGSDGYMDPMNFNDKHKSERFEQIIQQCINDHRNTAIVRHHNKKYEGQFPVWVIAEFLSIGSLSYFYGDMKNEDKKKIAIEGFGVNYQTLESWLRCITDLRNKCAHCSRLYYWKFTAVPRMPRNIDFTANHRLFSQLYMLKMMYPMPERWNTDFFEKFEKLVEKYNDVISAAHIGLPNNWKELLYQKE